MTHIVTRVTHHINVMTHTNFDTSPAPHTQKLEESQEDELRRRAQHEEGFQKQLDMQKQQSSQEMAAALENVRHNHAGHIRVI